MLYNYICRLIVRLCMLAGAARAYFVNPTVFSDFFGGKPAAPAAYVFWGLMVLEMIFGIFPVGANTVGSEKHRKSFYLPAGKNAPDRAALKKYISKSNKRAAYVAAVWFCVFITLAALRISRRIGVAETALACLLFYVCDLICVVLWCPFQSFLMKNRCCVTCRIYNWDWFMLSSPLLLIKSFFSLSIVALAAVLLVKWEISFKKHPEYFWEGANKNLRCGNCTEKLCRLKIRTGINSPLKRRLRK